MASSMPLLPLSNPDTSVPDNTFGKIEKDDAVWKQYVDTARDFDKKMVEEWNKFLDVILVFIALFIAVLTSFVIETQKAFDPDPAKITNELLLNISKRLFNGSQETFEIPTAPGPGEHDKAFVSNALLFVSLALSIATAMVAMAAKLWLIRYISWERAAGSSYKLAMQRQKAYSGIQTWKLHRAIDSLPIWILIAVSLFGVFIHKIIKEHDSKLGYLIGVILLIGLTFLIIASCSAAFISSSPFQSPFSHFITWLFDKLLREGWKSSLWKKLAIAVLSTATAAVMIPLVTFKGSMYQLLIFVPIVGVFAVTARPEEEEESDENSNNKPPPNSDSDSANSPGPWFGYPQFVVLAGFTVFIPIAVASYFTGHSDVGSRPDHSKKYLIYIPVSSVALGILGVYGWRMAILNQRVQDTREAEAIAWLLESSQDPSPSLFEKAGSVATTTPRKARLLSEITISLFPHMIASHLRHTPGEHDCDELGKLLSCLKHLSEFDNTVKSSLYNRIKRNREEIKHPELPSALRNQLEKLRNRADSRLSEAAEIILSRKWERGKNRGRSLEEFDV